MSSSWTFDLFYSKRAHKEKKFANLKKKRVSHSLGKPRAHATKHAAMRRTWTNVFILSHTGNVDNSRNCQRSPATSTMSRSILKRSTRTTAVTYDDSRKDQGYLPDRLVENTDVSPRGFCPRRDYVRSPDRGRANQR